MLPFRVRWIDLVFLLLSCCFAAAQASGDFQSLAAAAAAAREAGRVDEAVHDYGQALLLRGDWAEGWWELGTMEYEANRYADAVVSLRKLTALSPNMSPGWSILGLSEFETKDYANSLTSLETAVKLGGTEYPEIKQVCDYHLALLLIRNGEFERGAALLHSAFGTSDPPQVKTALGLAVLRVPLLPSEVDPSQDALIEAAGDAAASGSIDALSALVQKYPQTPWLHYAYGRALDTAGQTEEALVQQKLEAGISSASALPWIEISRLALQLKQPQQAIDAAKKAVSFDADSSTAHAALAKALASAGSTQQAARETSNAAQFSQTAPRRDGQMIALYEAHAPTAPETGGVTDSNTAWSAAMEDYSAGRYADAIAALKSWVERNPSEGTAWAVMGLSEFALKDYANARIHLQRGIDLGLKGSAESVQLATNRLALLMIQDGEFDAATRVLTPFAGRPPLAEQTKLGLGLALLHISTLPDDLDAQHRELAQSAGAIVELLLASRYTEAFPQFQKLIAAYPATPWLHYAYGVALDSLSQYDEAKAQMRAETKISPESALPWIRLASIAVKQHLPADALESAQNAVKIAPDSGEAHYELGRAWLEDGDAQKSIAELERANLVLADNPEIHFVLALAYAKANQPQKAAAERAMFLRLEALASQHGDSEQQSILKTSAPQP
jgi:tetratricopeptide (TPR) repeat protein